MKKIVFTQFEVMRLSNGLKQQKEEEDVKLYELEESHLIGDDKKKIKLIDKKNHTELKIIDEKCQMKLDDDLRSCAQSKKDHKNEVNEKP